MWLRPKRDSGHVFCPEWRKLQHPESVTSVMILKAKINATLQKIGEFDHLSTLLELVRLGTGFRTPRKDHLPAKNGDGYIYIKL
jgi:hypothetical protein